VKTIIAGSRTCKDLRALETAIASCGWTPTLVLSGTAQGADKLGEVWAIRNGVSVERYPANWSAEGKKAGYLRNALMASKADALIALWDGESRGTQHMINLARRMGLRVHVHRTDGTDLA
jgi:hypothetical protein